MVRVFRIKQPQGVRSAFTHLEESQEQFDVQSSHAKRFADGREEYDRQQ